MGKGASRIQTATLAKRASRSYPGVTLCGSGLPVHHVFFFGTSALLKDKWSTKTTGGVHVTSIKRLPQCTGQLSGSKLVSWLCLLGKRIHLEAIDNDRIPLLASLSFIHCCHVSSRRETVSPHCVRSTAACELCSATLTLDSSGYVAFATLGAVFVQNRLRSIRGGHGDIRWLLLWMIDWSLFVSAFI